MSKLPSARICHLEDLIFFDGGDGAARALKLLIGVALGEHRVSIKVDGSPALYIGRNKRGQFVLTDKNGFSATSYDGLYTSSDQFIGRKMSRSNTPEKMANIKNYLQNIKNAWPLLESIVPKNFEGYIKGDITWFDGGFKVHGKYITFQQNTVLYKVLADSALGQKILHSKLGFAVHTYTKGYGSPEIPVFDDANLLKNKKVCLLDQETIKIKNTRVPLSVSTVKTLREKIQMYKHGINMFFDEEVLTKHNIEQLPFVFYSYINYLTKSRDSANMESRFIQWIYQSSKLSNHIKVKMSDYIGKNEKTVNVVFDIFIGLQQLKNQIISYLDTYSNSPLIAYIENHHGGEGYVITDEQGSIKLVDRMSFSAANFNNSIWGK